MGRVPRDRCSPIHFTGANHLHALWTSAVPRQLSAMKEFELEPGEHVVKQVRKHWFVFLTELLPYAIMAVLPFAAPKLLMLAPPMAIYATFFDFTTPLARAALGVWLLISWTSAWGTFTRYFLNAWVLTNERIVTIKQRAFFRREVASLLLPRVQDVTTNVNGILFSLLGIGNIKVQSAGADVEFTIRGIPHPEQMRDLILKYIPEGDSEKITGV